MRSVPRHQLAPIFFEQDIATRDWREVAAAGAGLDTVYSNAGLYTKLDPDGSPLSSTSQPSPMTRMLEALEIDDHHLVLEIGTGTGYNAALLCH